MSDAGGQGGSIVRVASGEVRLGRPGQVLDALLGSCVAIALIWREQGRCALAHCLLPESGGAIRRVGARHVDQAVASLLALMKAGDAERAQIEVIVAGGAAMLGAAGIGSAVGAANVAATHKYLAASGLVISHCDTGGRRGRLIRLDCSSLQVSIRKIERSNDHIKERYTEELDHAHA